MYPYITDKSLNTSEFLKFISATRVNCNVDNTKGNKNF
jgi:hypothetical protein